MRNDSGVYAGSTVPRYYDPLLAKLVVWGPDRDAAIARMTRALDEYHVAGVRTTIPFLQHIVRSPDFVAGRLSTHFEMLDRKLDGGGAAPAGGRRRQRRDADRGHRRRLRALRRHARSGVAGGDDNGAGRRRNGWREQARRDALRSNAWTW